MNHRKRMLLIAACSLGVISGCQSESSEHVLSKNPTTGQQTTAPRPKALAPVNPKLPPPPGIGADVIVPKQGDALTRAKLPLSEILPSLPLPPSLATALSASTKPTTTKPAATATAPADEPPLAAQQAYARGRQAWRNRQAFEAIRQLELALTLTPDNRDILQLLAQIYIASGNRVRGAATLERCVIADPTDAQSLYNYARLCFEQGQWPQTTVLMMRAISMNLAQADADLVPLAHYYIGTSLERQGYDAAAVAEFRAFLEHPQMETWNSQRVRELALLLRQKGLMWMIVGDGLNRLGQPEQAWDAYDKAATQGTGDDQGLYVRRLYTLLQLGHVDDAQSSVIERLSGSDPDAQALELVMYLSANSPRSKRLSDRLEQIYNQSNHNSKLALAVASLQPPAQSLALLKTQLTAKPDDRLVFETLIKQRMPSATVAEATELLRIVDSVMIAAPSTADFDAKFTVEQAGNQQVLLEAFDKLSQPEREHGAMHMLHGISLLRAERVGEGIAELDAAVAASPQLNAARLLLAEIALRQGDSKKAATLLEPLSQSTDGQVVALRVEVLSQTHRTAEALELVNRLLAQKPGAPDLVLTKAGLQIRQNDSAGAEQTLLDGLNSKPDEERYYIILFELYDSPSAPPDAPKQYQRLMVRLLGTIPNSRIAKLKRAELHDARGELPQAQALLQGLLNENPRDFVALDQLLETLDRAGRNAEAAAMLKDRINRMGEDRALLSVAIKYYARNKDQAKVTEIREKLALLLPPGAERDAALGAIYLQTKQPQKALESLLHAFAGQVKDPRELTSLLGAALVASGQANRIDAEFSKIAARFTEQQADVNFDWSMAQELAGNRQRSEEILVANLKKFPDHSPSNNGLGYAWADQGRNLDEAQKMIQAALNKDAQKPEYMDSMGWVLYKKGKFDEAVTWLQRARAERNGQHPVILDHLGDALFQSGKHAEAQQVWQMSLQSLSIRKENGLDADEGIESPELKDLDKKLIAKIEAVKTKKAPAVASSLGTAAPAKPGVVQGDD